LWCLRRSANSVLFVADAENLAFVSLADLLSLVIDHPDPDFMAEPVCHPAGNDLKHLFALPCVTGLYTGIAITANSVGIPDDIAISIMNKDADGLNIPS
jgi:hypothetical protein